MSFDYFYGQQSDLFTFYRVPKVLFTNERFWNISADAKMLYGILLDRMSLSAKNGWIDKNGRVYAQAAPSLSQAQRIKKLAQEGECTLDAMCEIMNEIKKGELDRVTFKTDSLRKYFPKSYTNKQMEDKIIQLLEQWQKKREKSMER